MRPNPSIERTRTGMALQALISFWALRALPARAAHVKRWALRKTVGAMHTLSQSSIIERFEGPHFEARRSQCGVFAPRSIHSRRCRVAPRFTTTRLRL